MRDTPIAKIMTKEVLSIGVHESVGEAIRLLALYPVHHLPVVDESGLKGMLSSADMLKLEHFLPKGGTDAGATFVSERFRITALMRQPAISARPEETIAQAASRMAVHGIHALPVVSECASSTLMNVFPAPDWPPMNIKPSNGTISFTSIRGGATSASP